MTLSTRARAATIAATTIGAALVFAAPAAQAAPVDAATFSGTFRSTCTVPNGYEGPKNGPYTCSHTATSLACAAVADTGSITAYAKVCRADLLSGSTAGSASVVWPGVSVWTCDNGAGTGTFRYQPSTAESLAFSIPVNLVVIGQQVVVSGSYTQAGTGRHIVVRAHFPAVCASNTTGGDYAGTVTPV